MDALHQLRISAMCGHFLSSGGLAELERAGVHSCSRKSFTVSVSVDGKNRFMGL